MQSKTVEIQRNGKIEVLSFRVPQICHEFPPEFLRHIKDTIQHYEETPEDTQKGMLERMKYVAFDCLIKECAKEETSASSLVTFYVKNEHYVDYAVYLLAFAINIHLFLFFNPVHPSLDVEPTWSDSGYPFRDGTTNTNFVAWSNPQGDTVYGMWQKGTLASMFDNNDIHIKIHFPLVFFHLFITLLKAWAFFRLEAPLHCYRIYHEMNPGSHNIVDPSGLSLATWPLLLLSVEAWWHVVYWIASFCGLLVSPVFYCIIIIDLFSHSHTVKLTVDALRACSNRLFWLLAFMVAIIYWYANIAFMLLWNQQADYQRTCSTLFQCFLSYT